MSDAYALYYDRAHERHGFDDRFDGRGLDGRSPDGRAAADRAASGSFLESLQLGSLLTCFRINLSVVGVALGRLFLFGHLDLGHFALRLFSTARSMLATPHRLGQSRIRNFAKPGDIDVAVSASTHSRLRRNSPLA